MPITTITPLPTPAPNRTDKATFSTRANLLAAALPTMVTQINSANADIQPVLDALPSLLGYMGYEGLWSAQAGAVVLPYSVHHNGSIWYALQPFANVASQTPGSAPTYWAEYKMAAPQLLGNITQSGGPTQITFSTDIDKYDTLFMEYSLSPPSGTFTVQLECRRNGNYGTTLTMASAVSQAAGFMRISNLHRSQGYVELRNTTNQYTLANIQSAGLNFGNETYKTDAIRLSFSVALFNNPSFYAKLWGIIKA